MRSSDACRLSDDCHGRRHADHPFIPSPLCHDRIHSRCSHATRAIVAAVALALSRLGGSASRVLVAKARGSNAVIVPIMWAFAHRSNAKRDASVDNIRTGNIGDGGVPSTVCCATEPGRNGGVLEKYTNEHEKLDTIVHVRQAFQRG